MCAKCCLDLFSKENYCSIIFYHKFSKKKRGKDNNLKYKLTVISIPIRLVAGVGGGDGSVQNKLAKHIRYSQTMKMPLLTIIL